MAVYFRHGSNGAYKTAYAVWFEILPALRSGRVVVTNIEGLKPLESIESLLGEKFPVSARLIRLFSRKRQGIELWQNWFSWMPVNALVVIDECQDIFAPEAGFKRDNALKRPLEDFLPSLPEGFSELFHERWSMADTSNLDVGDTDDVGETQLDEHGRLLYPDNYYGAFMRHRKYQWDVILLTPDYTSIPKWMQGCATDAFSHTSTDTFFRKRKPRIFNHRPKSSKTAPSTKQDLASCSSKKIPLDVFALYQSTGTGGFNASKADVTILRSPMFIFAVVIGLLATINFFREWYVLSSNSEDSVVSSAQVPESSNQVVEDVVSVPLDENQVNTQVDSGLANSSGANESRVQVVIDAVNPFYVAFPVFNNAESVYLTSVLVTKESAQGVEFESYRFRIDKNGGSYYIGSNILGQYGYEFQRIDECLIQVRQGNTFRMLTCPPNKEAPPEVQLGSEQNKAEQLQQFDIFNLSKQDESEA